MVAEGVFSPTVSTFVLLQTDAKNKYAVMPKWKCCSDSNV